MALAVGAPGRNLQHLKASSRESADQAAAIAARALNTNHSSCGAILDQPVDQAPVARRGVRGDQRCDLTAAVIDQRGGVVVLVNVDAEDQGGLLSDG